MKRKSNAPSYLTPEQVEKLIAAARKGSHGTRDALLVLLMYRHGFRASEAAVLEWSQIDLAKGLMQVRRLKNGTPATHTMRGGGIAGGRNVTLSGSGTGAATLELDATRGRLVRSDGETRSSVTVTLPDGPRQFAQQIRTRVTAR